MHTSSSDDDDVDTVYIYDQRKKNGFRYNHDLRIYEHVNKIYINQHEKSLVVEKDLRREMDLLSPDEIPLTSGVMFNVYTNESRYRTPRDKVRYALPNPFPLSSNRKDTCDIIMKGIFADRTWMIQKICRDFLFGRGPDYVILEGPTSSYMAFRDILLHLKPLVQECNSRLYTEKYCTRKSFEDVSKARVVLTTIGDRTLRKADANEYLGQFPIQYRGFVHRDTVIKTCELLRERGSSCPEIPLENTHDDDLFVMSELSPDFLLGASVGNLSAEDVLTWLL